MSDQPLASLSLTHVHYDPNDPISYVSAWLALLPQGLCIVYATLLLSTREIEIAIAFAGQLACEALNWGLKRLIKEHRPEKVRVLGKGYGMPSSHAQFAGYWSVYVTLWLWLRFKPKRLDMEHPTIPDDDAVDLADSADGNETIKSPSVGAKKRRMSRTGSVSSPPPDVPVEVDVNGSPGPSILSHGASSLSAAYALQLQHPHLVKFILSTTVLFIAFLVSISRIYLEYHTPRQVYIGASVGAAFASLWLFATEVARRLGYHDMFLDLAFVRGLRVRDLICEEDLVELGWTLWEQKRKLRRHRRRKSVRFAGLPDDVSALSRTKKGDDASRRKKKKAS